MQCERLMQSLGFACHQCGDTTVLDTPFQSTIDGDMFQLFIEKIGNGLHITDHGLLLHHAQTHGIDTEKKAYELTHLSGQVFDEFGNISITIDNDHDITPALGKAFNSLQYINQNLTRWKPKPINNNYFKSRVRNYFKQNNIHYFSNYTVVGQSGHEIQIPFATQTVDQRLHLMHCIPQTRGSVDWNLAYSVAGQMADIRAANLPNMNRHVIIDDEGLDQEKLGYLSNLLTTVSAVNPYTSRERWSLKFIRNTH